MTRPASPPPSRGRTTCTLAIPLVAAAVLAALPALAATRPYIVTESALTLPPGGMRLEFGETRDDWDAGTIFYVHTAELTYNVLSDLDLEASIPWVMAAGDTGAKDGPGDIRARAKLRLAGPGAAFPTAVSALLEVKLPTGISQVSTQQADYTVAGLATQVAGPVTVDGNLFYTFVGQPSSGRNLRNVAGLSVGLVYRTPVKHLSGVGEFTWERSRLPGERAPIAFVAGARYAIAPRLTLDANFLVGYGWGPLPPPKYERGLSGGVGLTWDIGP